MSKIKIRDILRGCEPARIQSVGHMQVIPLLSDLTDNRFSPPNSAKVSTSNYGTLIIQNKTPKVMIIPAQSAYVVKQAAQDHAMAGVGYIKAKTTKQFNDAMCIQQSQGGLISSDEHKFIILPKILREYAYKHRGGNYSRLWGSIQKLTELAGLPMQERSGNLVNFLNHFNKELDEFVAEFEPIDKQVGAIILIGGKVVGIERAPNYEFWKNIWSPLIRECYGSMAILMMKEHKFPPKSRTQVSLKKVDTLAKLKEALKEATDEEYKRVKKLVNDILKVEINSSDDKESNTELNISNLKSKRFIGQMIQDDETIVYCSLISTAEWEKYSEWYEASNFKM